MIQFEIPTDHSSILKVVGIGGGGGNAVNHMYSQQIDGVNFIICNTDAQALASSSIPNKVQLGPMLTSGLGAGANPQIGKQATEESLEEIRKILEVNTKMVFITAGMGGGTGTGGAPIVAKICRDLGILTVGIVTMPFTYEGKKRMIQAEDGIQQLKQYVDTLLIISNDKLRHQYGNLKMREAFEKADNVLATAAKCITDVISSTGQINVDFADVCTVMRNGGVAILGNAAVSGEDRAQRAIEEALNSPLLNDNDIKGAKWILININSSQGEHEFTMDEVEIIQSYLLAHAGESTDVILGLGYDESLEDKIGITLIATGFDNQNPYVKPVMKKEEIEEGKIVMTLQTKVEDTTVVIMPSNNVQVITPEETVNTTQTTEESTVKDEVEKYDLTPVLVEDELMNSAPMPTVEDFTSDEEPIHYTLFEQNQTVNHSKEAESIKVASAIEEKVADMGADAFHSPSEPVEQKVERIEPILIEKNDSAEDEEQNVVRPFLSKPSNIYANEDNDLKDVNATPEPIPVVARVEPVQQEATNTLFNVNEYTVENKTATAAVITAQEEERQSKMMEAEIARQKQMERLKKLRDLSFDVNANDPNSEFENVPAYVRKNMDLYNNTNPVEAFYSKLEISADDKNQGQLNTLNSFLDGNKPD